MSIEENFSRIQNLKNLHWKLQADDVKTLVVMIIVLRRTWRIRSSRFLTENITKVIIKKTKMWWCKYLEENTMRVDWITSGDTAVDIRFTDSELFRLFRSFRCFRCSDIQILQRRSNYDKRPEEGKIF